MDTPEHTTNTILYHITVTDDKDRIVLIEENIGSYELEYPILTCRPADKRYSEIMVIIAPGYRVNVVGRIEQKERD